MHVEREAITVTTAADGTVTAYSRVVNGRIVNVIYTKVDYAAGVDFTITAETTGIGIWTESDVNASTYRAPHQPLHEQDGTIPAGGVGDPLRYAPICLADERVSIVLAQGGNAKSGIFTIVVEGTIAPSA